MHHILLRELVTFVKMSNILALFTIKARNACLGYIIKYTTWEYVSISSPRDTQSSRFKNRYCNFVIGDTCLI